jgi:peptide/nickel transport system permease protein
VIRYLLWRIAYAVLTWLVAVVLIFLAMRVLPGNPLLARFGQHPDAEQLAQLYEKNGWNRPVVYQLGSFLWQLGTTGDLGESIARGGTSVSRELRERLPATVELALAALLVAIPLGVFAGVLAAAYRGRWPDHLCTTYSLLGVSVPIFFLGVVLRELLPFFPTSQRLPPTEFSFEPLTGLYLFDAPWQGRFDLLPTVLRHLFLPAITLSTIPAAAIAKITRNAMLETLPADYIRTAQAKGAGWLRIVSRHALANAAVPIVNISGLQIGMLLTGAVLTETVFSWPGLGKYISDAVVNDRDYAVVQAGAIVIAALFAILNLLLDVAYLFLDPRIRHSSASGMER